MHKNTAAEVCQMWRTDSRSNTITSHSHVEEKPKLFRIFFVFQTEHINVNKTRSTHRVRSHTILLLTRTLSSFFFGILYYILTLTFQPKTIPLARSFPIQSLNTVESFDFLVMLRTIVWGMHLLTLWPLNFQLQNHTTSRISQVIPYTKLNTLDFGIFRFWVMLQTDRQTVTDGLEHTIQSTLTDRVGIGYKICKL